jgi:hypothetical protein
MEQNKLKKVKIVIAIFIVGLFLSGLTAFPIETELQFAQSMVNNNLGSDFELSKWLTLAHHGISETNTKYPFLSYGYDWLAFAHIILAILFIGPYKDPIKNIWIIQFGLISCIGIFPLALISGNIRGIPFYWQLIDCSFGLFGGILLLYCYSITKSMIYEGK